MQPTPRDTAKTINNLAVLFRSQGDFEQAESLYRRALSIFEHTLDVDHPDVLMCRENFEELRRNANAERAGEA